MKRGIGLILGFVLILSLFGVVSAAPGDGNRDCPQITPPGPDFCPNGTIVGGRDANGCQLSPRCITSVQAREHIREQNRIMVNGTVPEGCLAQGSALLCDLNGTRTLRVMAGNSGNVIYQVKGVNMSTRVELYRGSDGIVYGSFGNNQTRAINYLPDEIQQKVQDRLKTHVNGSTQIELGEDGLYQVKAQSRARLFGFIPVRETTRLQIDPETGETLREYRSWWSFLASDEAETSQ